MARRRRHQQSSGPSLTSLHAVLLVGCLLLASPAIHAHAQAQEQGIQDGHVTATAAGEGIAGDGSNTSSSGESSSSTEEQQLDRLREGELSISCYTAIESTRSLGRRGETPYAN